MLMSLTTIEDHNDQYNDNNTTNNVYLFITCPIMF